MAHRHEQFPALPHAERPFGGGLDGVVLGAEAVANAAQGFGHAAGHDPRLALALREAFADIFGQEFDAGLVERLELGVEVATGEHDAEAAREEVAVDREGGEGVARIGAILHVAAGREFLVKSLLPRDGLAALFGEFLRAGLDRGFDIVGAEVIAHGIGFEIVRADLHQVVIHGAHVVLLDGLLAADGGLEVAAEIGLGAGAHARGAELALLDFIVGPLFFEGEVGEVVGVGEVIGGEEFARFQIFGDLFDEGAVLLDGLLQQGGVGAGGEERAEARDFGLGLGGVEAGREGDGVAGAVFEVRRAPVEVEGEDEAVEEHVGAALHFRVQGGDAGREAAGQRFALGLGAAGLLLVFAQLGVVFGVEFSFGLEEWLDDRADLVLRGALEVVVGALQGAFAFGNARVELRAVFGDEGVGLVPARGREGGQFGDGATDAGEHGADTTPRFEEKAGGVGAVAIHFAPLAGAHGHRLLFGAGEGGLLAVAFGRRGRRGLVAAVLCLLSSVLCLLSAGLGGVPAGEFFVEGAGGELHEAVAFVEGGVVAGAVTVGGEGAAAREFGHEGGAAVDLGEGGDGGRRRAARVLLGGEGVQPGGEVGAHRGGEAVALGVEVVADAVELGGDFSVGHFRGHGPGVAGLAGDRDGGGVAHVDGGLGGLVGAGLGGDLAFELVALGGEGTAAGLEVGRVFLGIGEGGEALLDVGEAGLGVGAGGEVCAGLHEAKAAGGFVECKLLRAKVDEGVAADFGHLAHVAHKLRGFASGHGVGRDEHKGRRGFAAEAFQEFSRERFPRLPPGFRRRGRLEIRHTLQRGHEVPPIQINNVQRGRVDLAQAGDEFLGGFAGCGGKELIAAHDFPWRLGAGLHVGIGIGTARGGRLRGDGARRLRRGPGRARPGVFVLVDWPVVFCVAKVGVAVGDDVVAEVVLGAVE